MHPTQTRDIFRRGHLLEELSRQHLIRAGFRFAPAERLAFSAADGLFRGHADGILIAGPELPGVGYPALWEHKALGDKGWRALERDGLEKAYPQYAAQVWLYQAYLDVTEHPAIFTATNANTWRACTCCAVRRRARAGLVGPRRRRDRGNPRRRTAAARLR